MDMEVSPDDGIDAATGGICNGNAHPIMVDITTGKEYVNGIELNPGESDEPHEMVVFKIRKKTTQRDDGVEGACTTDNCNCEPDSRLNTVGIFCDALATIADCRSRMCPYTLEAVLSSNIFGVNFQWMELGSDDDDSDNEDIELGTSKNEAAFNAVKNSEATTNVTEQCTSIHEHDSQRADERAGPSNDKTASTFSNLPSTSNGSTHDLSDVTSTTSGDLGSSSHGQSKSSKFSKSVSHKPPREGLSGATAFTSNSQAKIPMPASSKKKTSNKESSVLAALILKPVENPQSKINENETSSEVGEPLPQPQEDISPSRDKLPTHSRATSSDELEQSPTSGMNGEIVINSSTTENVLTSAMETETPPEEILPDTSRNDNSLLAPEIVPALSTEDITVYALPNAPSNPSVSSNTARPTMDADLEPSSNTSDVPVRENERTMTSKLPIASQTSSEPPTKPTETTTNISSSNQDSVTPSQASNKRPASPLQSGSLSIAQPPNKKKPTSEDAIESSGVDDCVVSANNEDVIKKFICTFSDGECARVRGLRSRVDSRESSVASSDKEAERQSDLGEVTEEGEINEDESSGMPVVESTEPQVNESAEMQVSESPMAEVNESAGKQTNESATNSEQEQSQPSHSTTEIGRKSSDKRVESQGTPTSVRQEGVTTRSKASRPCPASVKRQRADRAAKQNAQAKISSTLGIGNDKSSPVKSVETDAEGPAKRLRSSDCSSPNNSNNKNKKGQGETFRRIDENSSDVRSSSSRSSTPTLDESSLQQDNTRTRRSSSITALHATTPTTTAEESMPSDTDQLITSTEPKKGQMSSQVITVDSASSDSDLSSSDSGESQCSHISEIPLKDRLERKKRKEEKMRRRAMQQSGKLSSKESLETRHERRLKRKKGVLPNVTGGNDSPKLDGFLPRAQALLQKVKRRGTDQVQQMEPQSSTQGKGTGEDDIQLIDEVPHQSSKTANVSEADKNSSTDKGAQGSIHIAFPKDKTKSQRPSSSTCLPPGLSKPTDSSFKTPLTKSTSLPNSSSSAEAGEVIDLEDRPSWEFMGISSPIKPHQISTGVVGSNTASTAPIAPEKSCSFPKPSNADQSDNQQSPFKSPPPISQRRRSAPSSDPQASEKEKTANAASTHPPSNNESDVSPSLRPLRARKQIFDPKMEAIKISPKPVPKITKETIQNSTSTPTLSTKPKEKSGDTRPKERENFTVSSSKDKTTTNTSQQKPSAQMSLQKKTDDDIEILDIRGDKESPVSNTQGQEQQKSQVDRQRSESDKISSRRDSNDSVVPLPTPPSRQNQNHQSPQQKTPNLGQKAGTAASKPQTNNLSFIDGEIRVAPKPSSSTSASASSSREQSSSPGDSSRPSSTGNKKTTVDFTEDPSPTVDFENPPEDDETRLRNRNQRNRNRSGSGDRFRGGNRNHRGGPHQQYGNQYGGYGPPNMGYYNGPPRGPGPRPPFHGGPPPRANSINTLTSQGRYNQQGCYDATEPYLVPVLPPPELMNMQFNPQCPPPSLMNVQFNPQFVPRLTVQPNGVDYQFPPDGPPHFFPGYQHHRPPRWPRYRM